MTKPITALTGSIVALVTPSSHPYHHMGMPGTVVVPEETLLANMRAIITGLWNMGFRSEERRVWK